MADLVAGTLLGGRFDLHGIVGRGGSATVWLASDRLRGERVALKVLHPHLGADPSMRRRLRREVVAAGVLRGAAVLVPYDLHEMDGQVALSMPFHPGQTLAERVASGGPLPAEDVRQLGVRLAEALAEAHRAGVLHRDVTAGNVLLERPGDAVLTDFGLARVDRGGTRTTGLLGTAGYAAPEVYSGVRGDPRSDLYGLGAVLYLAATGRPAFSATDPIAALKSQLEESFVPLRTARPDLPADLAATIEALLRREPAERPPGAREVADRLLHREAPTARTSLAPRGRYLPPGRFTVFVRERDEDRKRRHRMRVDQGRAPATTETEMARWGRHLAAMVGDAIGIPRSGERLSPEDVLARLVAEEAGVPPDALRPTPVVLHRRFLLVDRTDRDTAQRLAEGARTAGFKAEVVPADPPSTLVRAIGRFFWLPIPILWVLYPMLATVFGSLVLPILIVTTVLLAIIGNSFGVRERVERSSVAWRGDLREGLAHDRPVPVPRFPLTIEAPALAASDPAPEAPRTRGQLLRRRADEALDGLAATITALPDLPDPARADLHATVRTLRHQAEELQQEVDRLDSAAAASGAPPVEISAVRSRLDRLRTLERAGDRVDRAEVARLEAAIEQHDADLVAEEHVEARLSACCAELLEIASTASRVRRELVAAPHERMSADDAVRRLKDEASLADRARQEAGRRATLAEVR
jgi:serine/threonine-protein kinase